MFKEECLAVRTAAEQNRRVPRSRVTGDFCIHISVQISCRYEVLFKFSAKNLVQAAKNSLGMAGVCFLASKRDLEHGSDERGRDPVAGHVGDENAYLIAFERKEIIEIIGNRAHGEIAGRDVDPGEARHFAGQDGCLNLLGDFKFLLNREEIFFLGENAVSDEETQTEYKSEKPDWFDVTSAKHPKADEISVKNEETVNNKPRGHDAEFEREAARRAEDK